MTWLILSQSFLLSAFVNSVNGFEGVRTALRVLKDIHCRNPIIRHRCRVLITTAINSAHRAAETPKTQPDGLKAGLSDDLRMKLISTSDWNHRAGNIPSQLIPWMIIAVWMLLLGA